MVNKEVREDIIRLMARRLGLDMSYIMGYLEGEYNLVDIENELYGIIRYLATEYGRTLGLEANDSESAIEACENIKSIFVSLEKKANKKMPKLKI